MSSPKRLVQFGAGNIGRSFVGQIFGRNGWEVVFVDVDRPLIEALNRDNAYQVVVRHPDGREERITVPGVRGVDARDDRAVAAELEATDYVATSVGAGSIAHVAAPLARESLRRWQQEPGRIPFDLILAENIHNGAALLRNLLLAELPAGADPSMLPAIVECSVGKMVPLIPASLREREPTTVYAEAYNTLIVDRRTWRHEIPDIPQLAPVARIEAYVDRKLFVHNMGHAAVAYLGHIRKGEARQLWELLEEPQLLEEAREAMECSADALAAAYPEELDREELSAHIEDLLYRFSNRALGDTVYRVGRDLKRKLGPSDRIVGALRLAERHHIRSEAILRVYAAALQFRAGDEAGDLYPGDREFHRRLASEGVDYALREVSGVRREEPLYRKLHAAIRGVAPTDG